MAKDICSVEGCDRPARTRGWCAKHYHRWWRHGDPLKEPTAGCLFPGCDRPHKCHGYCFGHARQLRAGALLRPIGSPLPKRLCSVEGCGNPHVGRGLCSKHIQRDRNHGDIDHERKPENAPRKYSLDVTFFDEIATERQAYWLGFITADGSISQSSRTNTIRVGLASCDTGHLVQMNADLESNRPLLFQSNKPAVYATFDSLRLVRALAKLGVGPRKSGVVQPWNGPSNLMPHYWRGLFDGDGTIGVYRDGSQWVTGISGSQACVRAFATWAKGICESTAVPREHKGLTWAWAVRGGPKPQLLASALYGTATIYLDRKYALAQQLMATNFPSQVKVLR